MFAGIDAPTSSVRTRAKLDWKPEQPELIADIDHPAYFTKTQVRDAGLGTLGSALDGVAVVEP